VSGDSTTRAIAAALEQLLFSQAAPTGFSDAYWTVGRGIYDRRRYAPLWTGTDAMGAKRAQRLALLCRAPDEGIALDLPQSVPPPAAALPFGRGADSLARRDLNLTFAFARYLATLSKGAVGPVAAGAAWHVAPPQPIPDSTLAALIETPDGGGIARVMPASPQYALLSRALGRLLALGSQSYSSADAGSGPLRPGSSGIAVQRLRQELVRRGDLPPDDASGASYDAAVTSGVRNFQRRVGLVADGRVGPATRAALDVPADVRALTVAANLERYRWIPRAPMGQTVTFDIAAGSARVSRNGMVVLNTRIRALSSCRVRIPPVLADTITRVTSSDAAITVWLGAGDSVVVRSAAPTRNTSACLVADDFTALRGALAPMAGPNSQATELYLIWPTAYVATDSALMYRSDATGADRRLSAILPAPTADRPAVCDSLAQPHAGATEPPK
jgi:murein L,D-transpeptidase YcbB/YkuD